MTARPPSTRITAASSPVSAPTIRSGCPGRSTPASRASSSPTGSLQAQPPPAANDVIRTIGSLLSDSGLASPTEAYRRLVALPVFNTGEAEHLGLAGSIPVRLRQRTREARVSADEPQQDPRRSVPRTDVVLADPRVRAVTGTVGTDAVRRAVSAAQERVRTADLAAADVVDAVL